MKKIISIFLSLCISVSVLCGMDFKTYAVEGTDYLSQSDVDFITEKYLYMLDETTKAMHIKDLTDIDHQNSDTYWQSVSYVINKIQSDLNKISPYMPKALSESELCKIGDESIKYISAGVEILKNVDYIVNEDTNTYQQCYHGLQIIGDICSVAGIKLGPLGAVLSILSTTFILADILNQAYVKQDLVIYEYELQIAYNTNQELPTPQDSNSSIKNEYYDGACALYIKYSLMQFRDNNKGSGDITPTEIPVSSAFFNTYEYTLFLNETFTNTATAYPLDASNRTLTYSSSNTAVAKVNSSGTVTPVLAGTATIYATAPNGVTAKSTITVLPFKASQSNGKYTITDCVGGSGNLVVPDYVNGKPITVIGDNSFNNCDKITSVSIPDTVTTIEDGAFLGCDGLTTIDLGNGVKNIGEFSFQQCTKLNSIIIPESVTSIGEYAFSYCTSLKTASIPGSVKSIENLTFWNSSALKNVNIGEGVTVIKESAFKGCTSLSDITLPDTLTEISYYAFENCSSLSSISIPNSVKKIDLYAFSGCSNLSSINIPDSVTTLGAGSFSYCTNLKNVIIGEGVTKIPYAGWSYYNDTSIIKCPGVFEGCTNLTTVTLPETLTVIGGKAFINCNNLTTINIPKNLNEVGYEAFKNCSKISTVYLDDFTAWLKVNFEDSYSNPLCYGGKLYINNVVLQEITIPHNITAINPYAFYNCSNTLTITIRDNIAIDETAFVNCHNFTINCFYASTVKSYAIANGINYNVIRTKYDASGDGVVNSQDLTALRKYLLDNYDISPDGNCNEDDAIDVRDLVHLKKKLAGIIA